VSKVIRCFFLEPVCSVQKRYLRRYVGNSSCPINGYHDAMVEIERAELRRPTDFIDERDPLRRDPRWPKSCACGHVFEASSPWQLFSRQLYRRTDTGEEMTLRDAPVGAMWDATWYHDTPAYCGPDGRSIVVKTPGGEWMIDSRASNCTLPNDREHKCWIRHGTPPDLTVDKNGKTCAAGAGSIQLGNYHGFLRNGHLEEC
jgi:hypothetical protein